MSSPEAAAARRARGLLGELPGLGCDVRVLRAVLRGITGLSWHSICTIASLESYRV